MGRGTGIRRRDLGIWEEELGFRKRDLGIWEEETGDMGRGNLGLGGGTGV